jgi:hypothetical protein
MNCLWNVCFIPASAEFSARKLWLLIILVKNTYIPRRDDGGNCMFIDHLADRILQQNDKLVEGLDLALELDTINEINRYGYAFPSQSVKEWFL